MHETKPWKRQDFARSFFVCEYVDFQTANLLRCSVHRPGLPELAKPKKKRLKRYEWMHMNAHAMSQIFKPLLFRLNEQFFGVRCLRSQSSIRQESEEEEKPVLPQHCSYTVCLKSPTVYASIVAFVRSWFAASFRGPKATTAGGRVRRGLQSECLALGLAIWL